MLKADSSLATLPTTRRHICSLASCPPATAFLPTAHLQTASHPHPPPAQVSCFVEFLDVVAASTVHTNLQGAQLQSSNRGGIRVQYSRNPFGRRSSGSPQAAAQPQPQAGHATTPLMQGQWQGPAIQLQLLSHPTSHPVALQQSVPHHMMMGLHGSLMMMPPSSQMLRQPGYPLVHPHSHPAFLMGMEESGDLHSLTEERGGLHMHPQHPLPHQPQPRHSHYSPPGMEVAWRPTAMYPPARVVGDF